MKFALLLHSPPAKSAADSPPLNLHWDLLIETSPDAPLAAWRLLSDPLAGATRVAATRLPDHRRIYLEYEGTLSGGRGDVRRIDSGEAEIHTLGNSLARVSLHGARLNGDFELASEGEQVVFRPWEREEA